MSIRRSLQAYVILLLVLSAKSLGAQEKPVLFHEDFVTLDNWTPFYFPNIKKHSAYTIQRDGEHSYLKAESNASASAIVYNYPFNVNEYRHVRWRWKVNNIYAHGNPRSKAGDDYPIRVYVMFEYDPATAGGLTKLKYALAKRIYGEYPPQSSLSYVWSSKEGPDSIIVSPYTGRAMMILLQKGGKNVGKWVDQEVDIVEDYLKSFGMKPPLHARIAIMNDSDNTGEHSLSFMDFLEVSR
jgi:hypothetical protein